jgi:hypothetical protein
MPFRRRFTAINALIVLLTWLLLALAFHLKDELWDTTPGTKKPDDTKKPAGKRTAVVVASQKSEDPTWLDEYFPKWEKNIYRVDDRKAKLKVPKNKGRESMVYLT